MHKEPVILVSDDTQIGNWWTNAGVTLPEANNATHSIALSPLFFESIGYNGHQEKIIAMMNRGSQGYFWSKTTKTDVTGYYRGSNGTESLPSQAGPFAYAFPLRCLVSTTNSYIIKIIVIW